MLALHTGKAFAGELVGAVEVSGALVAFDRVLAVALLLIGEPAPSPCIGVAVVGVERRVEVLDRLVVPAHGDEALAARRIGRADERVAVDRGVEIENRGAMVALTLVHEAASVEGLRRLRVEANG